MQKLLLSCAALLLLAMLFVAWRGPLAAQDPAHGGLPGARAAIDAARYPSLQAALDALPAEGGVVRLPAGTFEISEPLIVHQEDVWIEGSGTATHIKNVNTQGQAALILRPKDYADNRRARIWRIQISDLRITGNEKSGHGIWAQGVNEILLHAVTLSYHGGDGARLDDCYEDPRICNSLFTYNKKAGLYLSACHDIVVCGNQFEENQDAVVCMDGFNLCMTGNCVDDHLRNGVVIENTYGSVLAGNMIEECQGTAVVLDRDCYGITLSANVIAHEFTGGIDLKDAHGCAVSGNTFTIVQKNGLTIGPGSGRITVTGNNFSDSYIGDGGIKRQKTDSAASGITLTGASDVAVAGNLFSGLRPHALSSDQASRRLLFVGNIVTDAPLEAASAKQEANLDNE